MRRNVLALVSVAALAACAGKPAATDTFEDLDGVDQKSDSFSYRMKLVGSLDYGQTSDAVKYTKTPRYRAFKFGGQKGDKVDITVSSTDGDAVAWLTDNAFKTLAYNDDADATTLDAHLTATLPGNRNPSIVTYYIIFRDYSLQPASFTVALKGSGDFYSCKKDADCVVVAKNCCSNLGNTAVAKGEESAYHDSLSCSTPQICPLILTRNDHGMAECNTSTNKCEYVLPKDIACGGRSLNPHDCPTGFVCEGPQLAVDGPGQCFQTCGGIAGRQCDDPTLSCVDDPNDSCDPNAGGADCGGICKAACVQRVLCVSTSHFDNVQCKCVPNVCVQTQACIMGSHWDTTQCKCVADPTDCRTSGCSGANQQCVFCWGSYACIPNGAVC